MVTSSSKPQSSPGVSSDVIGEQRVLLHPVSWDCFELLLAELDETRGTRLAYDSGTLEIMSPHMPHEHTKRLLERFVDVLCEEMDLKIKSAGALTSKKPSLKKGMEPDSAFYIQNEPLIRHKETIDFELDPPPDLMIVNGAYVEKQESTAFPNLPLTQIPTFIEQSLAVGEAQTVRNFRQWVREKVSQI